MVDLPAITIANDRVAAVVLPQYGGRIWSLRQLSDRSRSGRIATPSSAGPIWG